MVVPADIVREAHSNDVISFGYMEQIAVMLRLGVQHDKPSVVQGVEYPTVSHLWEWELEGGKSVDLIVSPLENGGHRIAVTFSQGKITAGNPQIRVERYYTGEGVMNSLYDSITVVRQNDERNGYTALSVVKREGFRSVQLGSGQNIFTAEEQSLRNDARYFDMHGLAKLPELERKLIEETKFESSYFEKGLELVAQVLRGSS